VPVKKSVGAGSVRGRSRGVNDSAGPPVASNSTVCVSAPYISTQLESTCAATVADVTAGLAAAIAASEFPEFREVAATEDGTKVTLTANTPGTPFTVSVSTTNGGGADTQSLAVATPTPSAGPHHWDTPENWSGGTVPASGDDVFLEDTDIAIRFGLEQSAVALAALHISGNYTGEIGLARTNADRAGDYAEYRPRFLQIGAARLEIGGEANVLSGGVDGSGRLQIDTGAAATDVIVRSTGVAAEVDLPALQWIGAHASNTLTVFAGSVGVAVEGGDTAQLATLRQSGGKVRIGAGVTISTVERTGGGSLAIASGVTTFNQSGGATTILGSGSVATMNLDGGRVDYRTSGDLGSVTIDGTDAALDFSANPLGRTVADAHLFRGSILDPHETVTWSTGVQPRGGLIAV